MPQSTRLKLGSSMLSLKKIKCLFLFSTCVIHTVFIAGCYDDKPVQLPSENQYEKDGELMINICKKFSTEQNINKLYKAAVATQLARVIPCHDFYGECKLYTECLNQVIRASKSGSISSDERYEINQTLIELKNSIQSGKERLKNDLLKLKQ